MMSPVPSRCDRSLHCESVVYILGNALWFAPKRGQARIGSAPVRLQLRGTVSRRFSEDHEALLERDRCLTMDQITFGVKPVPHTRPALLIDLNNVPDMMDAGIAH
jgi:hypothetical protein